MLVFGILHYLEPLSFRASRLLDKGFGLSVLMSLSNFPDSIFFAQIRPSTPSNVSSSRKDQAEQRGSLRHVGSFHPDSVRGSRRPLFEDGRQRAADALPPHEAAVAAFVENSSEGGDDRHVDEHIGCLLLFFFRPDVNENNFHVFHVSTAHLQEVVDAVFVIVHRYGVGGLTKKGDVADFVGAAYKALNIILHK